MVTLDTRVYSWLSLLLAQPGARRVNYHNNYGIRAFLQTFRDGAEPKWQGEGVRVPEYVGPYLRERMQGWFPGVQARDTNSYLQFYVTGRLKVVHQSWLDDPHQIYWMIWRSYPRRVSDSPA